MRIFLALFWMIGISSSVCGQTNTFPSSGNVGIGTTSPVAKLDIDGSGISAGLPVVAINRTWANYSPEPEDNRPFVIRRSWDNKEALLTFIQDQVTHFVYKNDEAANSIRFRLINTDTESNSGLNANDNTILSLVGNKNGGGVGIKTSSVPAGYVMAVNGTAIAEEVVVKQSTEWPDYVFKDPNYKLPDLKEVETFIKQKKHLPGIPSKKEIVQNGQHLGAIQTKLLEKIEELTRYVIELEKRDNEKSREIDELKDRLNALQHN
jgi:hypothetical protein